MDNMTSESPILQVKHLTTRIQIGTYTATIVDDLNLDLYRGKTLALVGESGCGKSMTALSLMRILPDFALPPSGTVLYRNQDLLTISEKSMRSIRGGRIAMIFQDPTSALNPVYTIGNQLIEAAELHLGLSGDNAIKQVISTLKEVGIPHPEERLSNYPHQFSGGMRQRVMIAMALICKPDVLIADEPTTALDVTIQAQILDIMRELQKTEGMSLLLITHDMGIVAEMADDVIVMYSGQMMEKGNVISIFEHMAHPYTKGLFSSRPSLHAHKQKLHTIKGHVPSPLHHPQGCRFHPRCPFVMDKCRHGLVPDFPVNGNSEHLAKCWLYDRSEESAQKLSMMDQKS